MLVCYLTDEPSKIPAVRAALEPRYFVVPRVLGQEPVFAPSGVLMVDADLREAARVTQIKRVLGELRTINEKLFVVHRHLHHLVAQAYALGATGVIHGTSEAVYRLAQVEIALRTSQAAGAEGSVPPGITDSGQAFAAMFSAIGRGETVNFADAEIVTSQIIATIAQNGLNEWLDDVRKYHQGTFQHCLLVAGVAIAFAMDLNFTSEDVKRLGIAATLHDVGKARIPLSILDKPAGLDRKEEAIMKQHPVIGYDLLKDIRGIGPEILDAVKHHHEYLDGSGYPDALQAGQISDLVRLLTISDVFGALIESRPYRAPMPRRDAYKVLTEMDGKLEAPLVRAFSRIAKAA